MTPGADTATAAEAAGLADIVRRRNWVYGWAVAGMPIIYGAGMLLGEHSWIVTIAWAAVFFGVITWHMLARCPRCRRYFNWSSRRSHHFAEECTHCRLNLHATP